MGDIPISAPLPIPVTKVRFVSCLPLSSAELSGSSLSSTEAAYSSLILPHHTFLHSVDAWATFPLQLFTLVNSVHSSFWDIRLVQAKHTLPGGLCRQLARPIINMEPCHVQDSIHVSFPLKEGKPSSHTNDAPTLPLPPSPPTSSRPFFLFIGHDYKICIRS